MALKRLLGGIDVVKGDETNIRKRLLFPLLGVVTCLGGVIFLVANSWGGSQPVGAEGGIRADDVGEVKNISDPFMPESFVVMPEDGSREINPVLPVTIKVTNGEVRDVKLTDSTSGASVKGEYSSDAGSWTTTQLLDFSRTYHLEYSTVGSERKLVQHRQEFSTVSPAYEANAWVTPGNGATVGVGQPIQIDFSEPVINRDLVQKAIKVSASSGQKPVIHWYSDTMLRIRPPEFWAAKSQVSIEMNLLGVEFGNGMIGNSNFVNVVNISSERRAVVDNKTKTMSIIFDGEVVKTMPVTLGAKHMPSTSGWHVLSGKAQTTKFDPRSIGLKPGDKDWYEPFDAQWTFRLSNSGEFVHQALPSAFRSVGKENVSHGCVGLLPADAQWFWQNMQDGDPVQILNTQGKVLEPLDGFGDWNVPWEQWTR